MKPGLLLGSGLWVRLRPLALRSMGNILCPQTANVGQDA
jgi:hypothetical protein